MRLKKPKAIENDSLMKVFLSGNLNYKFELTTIKFKLYDVGEPKINTWSSYKGRRANALELGAEEGRGKLRKVTGSRKQTLNRKCPNGENHMG